MVTGDARGNRNGTERCFDTVICDAKKIRYTYQSAVYVVIKQIMLTFTFTKKSFIVPVSIIFSTSLAPYDKSSG